MVVGGYFQTIIPRNTTVPTSETHLFTTVQDNQTSVRIAVLQGESDRATDNELLGEFVLDGIRPARRGEVEIEVTFDISADGIVGVSARDVVTGQQQSITVTATSGLTEEEMKRILDERVDEMLEKKQTTQEFDLRRDRVDRDHGRDRGAAAGGAGGPGDDPLRQGRGPEGGGRAGARAPGDRRPDSHGAGGARGVAGADAPALQGAGRDRARPGAG